MKVVTIQHRSVCDKLFKEGFFKADKSFVSENLIKPYEFASSFFGWDNIPIFLSPVGYKVEMYGAKNGNDYLAMELDIPEEFLKFQEYYNWTDFVYYMEVPGEFKENFYGFKTVEEWGKTILDVKLDKKLEVPYQAMVLELRSEWITFVLDDISKLSKKHNGTGGFDKLKILKNYMIKKEG